MTSERPRPFLHRYAVALTMSVLAMLILAMPASAARSWCSRDPIVTLNGQDAQLWVAIPEEYQSLVTGAIEVEIAVPEGVSTQVRYLDEGFNGHGETVRLRPLKSGQVYADGSFDLRLRVTVPIDHKRAKSIPLQLTANIGGTAHEVAPGVWEYHGGQSHIVEMTNSGAVIEAIMPVTAP